MRDTFTYDNLLNFGFITSSIPESLYKNLLKECNKAEQNNTQKISGLTGDNVTKHYYVNETKDELNDYIKYVRHNYELIYPGVGDIKILTDSVDYYYEPAWVNIQKQHEFIPNHTHDGFLSWNIWMKVPYGDQGKYCGNFEFTYIDTRGKFRQRIIKLTKESEGTIIMFPAGMQHSVYPFYNCDEPRISVSSNVLYDTSYGKK